VGVLPLAALSVNDGAGTIEKVVSQGPGGSMCSQFVIYAKASRLHVAQHALSPFVLHACDGRDLAR
jgi:hypothetical protein